MKLLEWFLVGFVAWHVVLAAWLLRDAVPMSRGHAQEMADLLKTVWERP